MSFDTISKMIQVRTQSNNMRLQQMDMMKKSIDTVSSLRKMKEEQRSAKAREAEEDIRRSQNIMSMVEKTNFDSLRPEDRVRIEEAKRFHTEKIASRFIHYDDSVSAALSPPSSDEGKKVQHYSAEYNIGLLQQDGASIDQQEYHREMAKNNMLLAEGKDPIGIQYAEAPQMSLSIIRENNPDFSPSEVAVIPEDYEVRFNTFKSVALNYYKQEFENDSNLDARGRMIEASKSALEDMGIDTVNDAEIANSFISGAIEGIISYRESEGQLNMKKLEALNATNLVEARDGLNKLGYEVANLTPSELINRMESDIGFRNLMDIGSVIDSTGDDSSLMSDLNEYVTELNPNAAGKGITERERRTLVKKNFLDVLAKRVEKANTMTSQQKIAAIRMIDRIDDQIDNGGEDPVVTKMLDHAYTRWAEGYSEYAAERIQQADDARNAGNGIIIDPRDGNKQIRTTDDFSRIADVARSTGDSAAAGIAEHYERQVKTAPAKAGWSLIKDAYTKDDGTIDFRVNNKQFLFGSNADNSIQLGLSDLMNFVVLDVPLDQLKDGKTVFGSDVAKQTSKKVMEAVTIAASIGTKDAMKGLFSEWNDNNPLKKAGLEMETYKDRDGKEYVVPPEIANKFARGFEFNNLKDAALNSEYGAKAVYGAMMHAYQVDAQAASDTYLSTIISGASLSYPELKVRPDGSMPQSHEVIMKHEMQEMENNIPYLTDPTLMPAAIDGEMIDDVIKYKEALGVRRAKIQTALKQADDASSDRQRGAFEGTLVGDMVKDMRTNLEVLSELEDALNDFVQVPKQPKQYESSASISMIGIDRQSRTETESRRRDKIYNRLSAVISDIKDSSN